MFVTQRAYADFITWTPQACLILRVTRDEEFISAAISVMQRMLRRQNTGLLKAAQGVTHQATAHLATAAGGQGVQQQSSTEINQGPVRDNQQVVHGPERLSPLTLTNIFF